MPPGRAAQWFIAEEAAGRLIVVGMSSVWMPRPAGRKGMLAAEEVGAAGVVGGEEVALGGGGLVASNGGDVAVSGGSVVDDAGF